MPVLSRATCFTCPSASQWSSSLSPGVVVRKVRISFATVPCCWLSSRPATTVFWWTSKPQQRSYTTCIRSLLSETKSLCETRDTKRSGERCGSKTHSFLHVLTCITGGDTHLFGTHQDQLRTRVPWHQPSTISSRRSAGFYSIF